MRKLHSFVQIFPVSLLVEQGDGDTERQGSDRPVRKGPDKSTSGAQRSGHRARAQRLCGQAQGGESAVAGAGKAGADS